MFKFKQNLYCFNCGKSNHKFANCNEPIISYGLISYYKDKIVLVRRKYTFALINFVMGKYSINDVSYLTLLFSRMTRNEIKMILTSMDFDIIRDTIGLDTYTRAHRQEYENSKVKFTYVKNMRLIEEIINNLDVLFGERFINVLSKSVNYELNENGPASFSTNKDTISKLRKIILHQSIYDEPEWEIPKGKRNDRETNISAAIREYVEETRIDNVIVFKNIIPLEEEFDAMNNTRYKYIYYIATVKNINDEQNMIIKKSENSNEDIIIPMSEEELIKNNEISCVAMVDINNIDDYLRCYQIEKKKVIYKSYQIYNNYKSFFY